MPLALDDGALARLAIAATAIAPHARYLSGAAGAFGRHHPCRRLARHHRTPDRFVSFRGNPAQRRVLMGCATGHAERGWVRFENPVLAQMQKGPRTSKR